MRYRDQGWVKYVMRRAEGDKEKVVDFYVNQQRELRRLFDECGLEKYVFNVEDQNYVRITRAIIDIAGLRPDQLNG